MVRYISVDSGKDSTKVAEYLVNEKKIVKFSLKTKVSEGDFRDDALEKGTMIAEIDGHTYKIGNGARGAGAELDTNKMTDIHKICTLAVLAGVASADEIDEFNVVIAQPAKDWANVSKREDYKAFILPEGNITVSIRWDNNSPVTKKTFVIKKRFAFAESMGALGMDEMLGKVNDASITGVIDIGNLNLNATLWKGHVFDADNSSTEDLGGAILIQELAQEISANIVTCNEMIAESILNSGSRQLPNMGNLTAEQIEESKKVIKNVLKKHAAQVKRCCRSRNWSLDLMNVIAIGGTAQNIAEELQEAFGKNLIILKDSRYCNVLGNLRTMCGQLLGEFIEFNFKEKEAPASTATKTKNK